MPERDEPQPDHQEQLAAEAGAESGPEQVDEVGQLIAHFHDVVTNPVLFEGFEGMTIDEALKYLPQILFASGVADPEGLMRERGHSVELETEPLVETVETGREAFDLVRAELDRLEFVETPDMIALRERALAAMSAGDRAAAWRLVANDPDKHDYLTLAGVEARALGMEIAKHLATAALWCEAGELTRAMGEVYAAIDGTESPRLLERLTVLQDRLRLLNQ